MDAPPQSVFRFAGFELDLAAYRLRRDGRAVRLERRPMELLVLLLQRGGQLVPREEIIEKLWGGKVVIDFDAGLNTLVRKVRHALGDAPESPAFIETVTGKGYRFIAPIEIAVGPPQELVVAGARKAIPTSSRWAAAAVAMILAVAAAAWLWRSASTGAPRVTVAVLPFDTLSSDGAHEYLALGLAEDTIVSLGQIDPANLQVIGPASTQAYKRSGDPLASIREELGADYVVHSSLRMEGAKLRVTSSLTRLEDHLQVWTATFDRELTSVLGLQQELSAAIAEQVRIRLSPARADALAQRHTRDPQAYDLYLRGRHAHQLHTAVGNRAALDYYDAALARDPSYALAWAGVAYVLAAAPINSDAQPTAVFERAREGVQRAMNAAPALGEAHFAHGYFHLWLDPNWTAATASLRKAIDLDPNSAVAHMILGHVLSQRGEHLEARALLRRARELDPLFPMTYALSSQIAYQARDFDAALEFARQAVAMSPEFWIGRIQLAQALEQQGKVEAAVSEYAEAERYSGENSKSVAFRAYTLGRLGRADDARVLLAKLETEARERYVPPYMFAVIHAGLGEADQAFDWLERAFAVRDVHLAFLPVDVRWDDLRNDPRFAALIERCAFYD
jgi:TolB-like protein/DNA-binding winged helix-turn-helix (wHTH) protein